MNDLRTIERRAQNHWTTTQRCAKAFAKLNGWSLSSAHFSFRQLAGKGCTRSNDDAPLWWTGAQILVGDVMDHVRWFRQNRKPIAIISMPYLTSIENAQKLAQHYGLVACEPPIELSGWWAPKHTSCFAFVRPGTTVRWLPEQCDPAAFEAFAQALNQ